MKVDPQNLTPALERFLPNQRWFGAKGRDITRIYPEVVDVVRSEWPALIRVEAVVSAAGIEDERYNVLIGLRPAEWTLTFLEGNSEALLGELSTDEGPAWAYEAVRDTELSRELFKTLFPDILQPARVRPITAEMSNTMLIYDDQVVFKIFRTLSEKVNLDLEVTEALGNVGFSHVAAPLGVWRKDGTDLGMVQPYLAGGVEGWAMALTSLRDMFGSKADPWVSGGDFAAEAFRLGTTTGELHGALAEAFGTFPGNSAEWAKAMEGQLDRIDHSDLDKEAARRRFDRLAALDDCGPAIRIHGDMHLGQVMRTDTGWFVLDFGGEPSRPVEERRMPTSPMKDVAGMLRSLHYATWTAAAEQEDQELAHELAHEWEQRNRGAFVDGYLRAAREAVGLLPKDEDNFGLVLKAFELDRGIYEIGYELAHRPEWVKIPMAAIQSLY
ncbi:phosphotransferase [soil metagenome]